MESLATQRSDSGLVSLGVRRRRLRLAGRRLLCLQHLACRSPLRPGELLGEGPPDPWPPLKPFRPLRCLAARLRLQPILPLRSLRRAELQPTHWSRQADSCLSLTASDPSCAQDLTSQLATLQGVLPEFYVGAVLTLCAEAGVAAAELARWL